MPSRQIIVGFFYKKGKTKTNELVARPDVSLVVVWVRGGVGAHHVLGQVGEKSGQLSVAAILTDMKSTRDFI